MTAAPGFQNWTVDPDTLDTTVSSQIYDNFDSIGTIVQTQVGTTDSGAVFDMQIGPPDDQLNITEPTLQVSVQADGTTTVNVAQGKITITMNPDGTMELNTDSDISVTCGGAVKIDATANVEIDCVDANVNPSGDCNIMAGGNIVAMGTQIQLNGSSGMVLTTVTDPVVDLITGAPTMGVSSVLAG